MKTATNKLQCLEAPETLRSDFRDRSGERSQKESTEARRPTETPPAASLAPLVISIETTERLRQILRTEKLASESDLFAVVKDALALQYMRGVNEGVAQSGKDPRRRSSRQSSNVPDSWEQHRRAQRKSKLKNYFATAMVLLMAATAIFVISMFRPSLSGDTTVKVSEISR
jgi:hypothetical protein